MPIDPVLAAANSYFAPGIGGTGSGGGTVTGTGSGQPALVAPAGAGVAAPADGTANLGADGQEPFFYAAPGGYGGGYAIVGTNGVVLVPTNANPTNVPSTPSPGGTNVPAVTNGIVLQPGAAPPYTPFPGPTRPNNAETTPPAPSAPSVGVIPPDRRPNSPQGVPQRPAQSSRPAPAPATPPNR